MSTLLEQASLVMIPSGYKEDVVYSQIPTSGAGDLSFTRASNGTRINSAGLVEVCPWNLVGYSEQFDNAAWIKFNCSITPNDAIAPNGTQTADKVVFSGSGHYFYQQTSFIGQATASIYVKGTAGETISIDNTQAITEPLITLTGEWQRITTTTTTSGSSVQGIALSTFQSATARTIYVWGGQVNAGTLKPYFPTTDRLNVPRLTYQNGGGGCPSLLLEKQSTNIVTYSEDFSNADWGKYQCSISANQTTSPDGTQNADKLTLAVGSGTYTGLVYRLSTPGANSIFMKNDSIGNGKFYIQVDGIGNARWNTDGTLISVSGGTATNGENMGNGWFRFTYVCSGGAYINYGIENGTTGDSIFIWGAQVEASSYATSYIPTTSSSATRVADACYKTGISSLIGASEGTLFLYADIQKHNEVDFYIAISNGASLGDAVYLYQPSSGNLQVLIRKTGNADGTITVLNANWTAGLNKVAIAYTATTIEIFINGVSKGSTTFTALPTLSQFTIGSRPDAVGTLVGSGIYSESILFPTRLTNAELASLTTI